MATNQQNRDPQDLFAPPTKQELSSSESDMFAPPRQEELFAPPKPEELRPSVPREEKAPDLLRDEDFQRIGQKYGVDPEELRSLAPYYGATVAPRSLSEAVQQGAKGAAGFLGKSLLFNNPQKLASRLQDEPTRKALDELQEIGNKQSGLLGTASEIVANPIAGIGSGAMARIGSTAGIGALQGYGESKEGEELKGALTGAAIGGGLGAAGELIGKLAGKYNASKVEQQIMENQSKAKQFDIEQGIEEISQKQAPSESLIKEVTTGEKSALSTSEIDTILDQQIGQESLAKYLDPSTEEGMLIRRDLGKSPTEQAIKGKLADGLLETRVIDFAEDLTSARPKNAQQALEEIEKFASTQGGKPAIEARYNEFLKLKQADEFINKEGIKAINEPNFFGRTGSFLSDAQFVARHTDEKFGTNIEGTIRDLNTAYNKSTFVLKEFRNKYDTVFKNARKLNTDDTVVNTDRMYRALDSGSVGSLTAAERQTVADFQKYFREIREFSNGGSVVVGKKGDQKLALHPGINPLSIAERTNYVPHMLKSTHELIPVMEKRMAQAKSEVSVLLGRRIDDLKQIQASELETLRAGSASLDDIIKGVTLLDDKPIKDGADLSRRFKEMLYTRNGNVALESKARATMAREGEIPYFMRETNLYKLARRYTDNTLRHLYLRNGLDKLGYQAKALEKAGAEVDAQYFKNIIKDVLGVRQGTAAEAMLQTRIALNRNIDKLLDKYGRDSVAGGVLTSAKAIPAFIEFHLQQIYPNALGYLNIRAAIQNATSGFTKLAPELGGVYGYEISMKGALYARHNFARLSAKAREMGNIPAEFTRKGEQAIAEGIARSSSVTFAKGTLEGFGKAGMIFYQKIEDFNRALVLGVGEMMAHDLSKSSPAALRSLSNFPPNIRKEIYNNRQNVQYTAELIGKHLNDVTQYNYNKISMSEFGRTMGPFFSTFSKWPTATAGDILNEMRSKGVIGSLPRNLEKYFAPWVLLKAVDYAAGQRPGDDDSLSDVKKKLLGSGGLSQSAPIGAVAGFIRGEQFTPPAVDAVYKGMIEPVVSGKADLSPDALPETLGGMARKTGASLTQSFMSGAGLVRLLTDDLVTFATGRKPEGDFFERTTEGAKQLTK